MRATIIVLVLVLAGGASVVIAFDAMMERFMCDVTVKDQMASPSGDSVAVIFDYGCGVGSSTNTQVSVLTKDAAFSPNRHPSFLRIDGDHKLTMRWLEQKVLQIAVPRGPMVYLKDQPPDARVIYQDQP